MKTKNVSLVKFFSMISVIMLMVFALTMNSCEEEDTLTDEVNDSTNNDNTDDDNDDDDDTPITPTDLSNDHWFFGFNGTIDGGEGYDVLKSSVDNKIYICGAFLHVNNNWDMKNLTRWDPVSNTWEQVPGIDSYHTNFIRCVTEDEEGNLYFGGDFSTIGGQKAGRVGKFNVANGTWSALRDKNFYNSDEEYGPVSGGTYAIAYANDYVYIGGGIFNSDSAAFRYIRRYNVKTSTWETVGGGLNGRARCLTADADGNIYAGGEFTEAGGVAANYIAKWNGTSWEALGDGTDDYVLAIKTRNGKVYAGGSFKYAGGSIKSQGIAMWNGSAWEAMGDGVYSSWGDSYSVQEIAIDSDGKVYIGGFFDRNYADDDTLNHVGIWDDNQWKQLGYGLATTSSQGVMGMNAFGKDVYFVGYFSEGNGNPNAKINVAIWNETKDYTE